jgi:hypothetical protein
MKIAITDASIFIDLYELGGLGWLKTLGFEVHTTDLVLNELSDTQLKAVRLVVDKVAELSMMDIATLQVSDFPRGLSNADRSLIWYHERMKEKMIVLFSSDKLIRTWAIKQKIEVHGILWVLDEIVAAQHLTPQEAISQLNNLMQINAWLPLSECKKRLDVWGDEVR